MKRKPMRRTPMRRKPLAQRYRAAFDRHASESWARGVRGKRCVVCSGRHPKGHHILTQQHLRKRAAELGIDAQSILWDERNRLAVCEDCHTSHHAWVKRLPRTLVVRHAPKVGQFARELELGWLLDREYPPA